MRALVLVFASVIATTAALLLVNAARAADSYPCGATKKVSWSTELVQPCPLSGAVDSRGWIPVYAEPIPNPRGSAPPPPAGWLQGTSGKYFVCERYFTNAVYYHPGGWRNYWWGYTRSDEGVWGWVPEVFFRGGLDDEPDGVTVDAGLRGCPSGYPSPPPPPPAPATFSCEPSDAATLRLSAAFSRHRKQVTTGFRRGLKVGGRLTDTAGNPLVGAPVCVSQIDPRVGALRQAGTVLTDERGRFSYRIDRRGVSRRLWFVHRTASGEASTSVTVRVRAPASLKAKPAVLRNGQTVVLHGRVGGGSRAQGILIEVQAKRGNGYQTFGTTRIRKQGRFKYKYRFTRTFGLQRYELRVKVPEQRGYPYATGASRPVTVTVLG